MNQWTAKRTEVMCSFGRGLWHNTFWCIAASREHIGLYFIERDSNVNVWHQRRTKQLLKVLEYLDELRPSTSQESVRCRVNREWLVVFYRGGCTSNSSKTIVRRLMLTQNNTVYKGIWIHHLTSTFGLCITVRSCVVRVLIVFWEAAHSE